jgi:hypothetical protein
MRASCWVIAVGCFFSVVVSACSCSSPVQPSGTCTIASDCMSGQLCVDSHCVSPSDMGRPDVGSVDAAPPNDAWGYCTVSANCGAGYACAGGHCCLAADVCGVSCCGATETCFAGACVTPGASCRTTADCASGQYCEPALGMHGDGGVSDGGATTDAGRACTAATPDPGRCLALPPTCPTLPDGGALDAGTTTCTTTCEYHPPVGALTAVTAWEWGQPNPPPDQPAFVDVWSTPTVGRVYDANCDGHVDDLDPPNVIFVSGHSVSATTGVGTCCQCTGTTPTSCHTGVLRALDGRTGDTVWSLRSASATSAGFSATSVAIGDVDADGRMDVVAVTGEGYVVLVDGTGHVVRTSDMPIPNAADNSFGWGGGLALGDMDGDGHPEIAWGNTVFHTTGGTITRAWTGTGGSAGGISSSTSAFADVDEDGHLELIAGNTAYRADGTILWNVGATVPDGFPAIADMNGDGHPEVIVISPIPASNPAQGAVRILRGRDGMLMAGPFTMPGTGDGGPPTVADFNGDHRPEIGVAQRDRYSVMALNLTSMTLSALWSVPNHDLSSSVTGSTVFDFEGDGIAEVVYADECFLWVFDGPTGNVRYAGMSTSFTGTEASVVADVDGDGHAEIVLVSNGADPSANGWRCLDATGMPTTVNGVTWQPSTTAARTYRGIRVLRDSARSWVGTRGVWNQHSYHVTNICVPGDGACAAGAGYGAIPAHETPSWTLGWLNDFRQNVQQSGVFDAADAALVLEVRCETPVQLVASLRNLGSAILPPNVRVDFFRVDAGGVEVALGSVTSTTSVFPGALTQLTLTLPASADPMATYRARINNPTAMPTFHECRTDNDQSMDATGHCVM